MCMKKLYKTVLLVTLAVFLTLSSCKKDTIDGTIVQGYEYFMTDEGRYNEFAVDSTQWDDFNDTVITYLFDIREVNDSLFLDNSGDTTVRLERLRRDSVTGPWYIKDVWSMKRTATTAEKVEENERFIKLRFPIKEGYTWNGNLYNTQDPWEYKLTNVGQPFTVNGITFAETVTVEQTGTNDPLINKQLGKEVYAKGVGLIYKELAILEGKTEPDVIGLPFDDRIKKGFKMKMSLTNYYPQ